MKGKIAFVLGLAVGYVLGTRAGRQRYEQIKRGAATVWNAEPVQRGVSLVRDAVDERADEVVSFVRRASADAFSNYVKRADEKSREKKRAGQSPEAGAHPADETPEPGESAAEAESDAETKPAGGAKKPAAKKPAARKPAAKKPATGTKKPPKGEA